MNSTDVDYDYPDVDSHGICAIAEPRYNCNGCGDDFPDAQLNYGRLCRECQAAEDNEVEQ